MLVVGDVIDDVVVRVTGPASPGSDTPAQVVRRPGGSGANTAAWLGALGVPTRLVARVGQADLERHAAALRACGVQADLVADPLRPTGTIVVLVRDGERSFLTDRGANRALCAADVAAALGAGVRHVHLSGYLLGEPPGRRAAARLLAGARVGGASVSVDPSSVALLRALGPAAFLTATRGASVLLPNLAEGRALTGARAPDRVVDALLAHYPVVALTLGAEGALCADRSGGRVHLPARAARVVDPTGAGDAFAAGFLAAWLAGAGLAAAGRRGVRTAARAVRRLGGRPG